MFVNTFIPGDGGEPGKVEQIELVFWDVKSTEGSRELKKKQRQQRDQKCGDVVSKCSGTVRKWEQEEKSKSSKCGGKTEIKKQKTCRE